MNLTTHILLECAGLGVAVLSPVPKDLLSVQEEVRLAFGWHLEDDEFSAKNMANEFSNHAPFNLDLWSTESRTRTLKKLKQSIHSAERLMVVGAGSDSIRTAEFPRTMFVAADGAVGAIDDLSRVLCVVSDGDGAEHLDHAAQHGVHIVLHAHGDNAEVWTNLVKTWSCYEQPPPLTLTHQTMNDYAGMHNPGGFTDGDRALCFIQAIGRPLNEIGCIGFRTDIVGPWSGTTEPERKKEKLAWMEEVMQRLGVEHHLIR